MLVIRLAIRLGKCQVTKMAFAELMNDRCPDIADQSASELREFLVTAQKRQQMDSQTLSMGLQTLKQEVLDEGYNWSELITNLVVLVGAELQEDEHERFMADLERFFPVMQV